MTSMTASAIITKAYQDAQRVARLVTPSSDQQTDGLDRLHDIVTLWQTQGLKLFLEQEVTVTLVEDQQTYSAMSGGDINVAHPLELKECVYWDSSDSARPLDIISRNEWAHLSDRTQTGSPTQVFAEKLYDRMNLRFWHIPDATAAEGTVKATFRIPSTNPATTAASVLFPSEWAIALRWALADELAAGMPEAVQTRCAQRAAVYKKMLEDWDVENDDTYFRPDEQFIHRSKFR